MNPENPNFENIKENSTETQKTPEEMFEYSKKKEIEALENIPHKYKNCYEMATNFAEATIKSENSKT